MARQKGYTSHEAGIFSRQGELYTGGAPEGFFQAFHPAARFLSMFAVLLGISVCRNAAVLAGVFAIFMFIATLSFLNLRAIYKVVCVPVLLMAVPSWIFAAGWYNMPLHAGTLFFLRTLVSVTVASTVLHSIGLRRINDVLGWFKLPTEVRQLWNIMISQVASFAELVSDMALARSARIIRRQKGDLVRRQVGRQMGILFARTYRRGSQLGLAINARQLSVNTFPGNASYTQKQWAVPEYLLLCSSVALAIGAGIAP